ncbi:bifunctional adenosylcobinamide kinase/adenosylcobinamide-phosphate guanylyltransferase [Curvibacter sp. RS43]|uniref:Bifunctional adenosylcobalamin biosynthesis protein n=1 Tax=Curvibacter microcysteis TaxID=3026419 RepID=A0ABT5MPH0_9BURK|nr:MULTISPECIES: bifunctional adenosylcobinamide kinase/adenosylcobinamide-phosphate guanylyltransferase [unclassified Curvibacter]MDD0808893.1 bifunctional adenosylcobinamide kinase/adenosylcobinamide-phosphate guanylyltransferase [Curvibacter sp. RS43]MDD0817126.1 bifunctional adenosylcobinamide kinase/adenosylcobinamide-phosphate guanylyltransferase [Curvibacter sp. HBC28]
MSQATHEFILGGQKSGKSARAETLAQVWLQSPQRQAWLIATAQPWDDEMSQRIARHQQDRALRVPGLRTHEEPRQLAEALRRLSAPDTLVVVDCLTLWLTNWLMPAPGQAAQDAEAPVAELLRALAQVRGPVVLVGNEIGLGVIPMGREVRQFVDRLGRLNQQVAAACDRVTLMAAGLPLSLKAENPQP